MSLFVGLMSGTSLDGVDGVLVAFSHGDDRTLAVKAHRHAGLPVDLRDALLALNAPGANELHQAALAANRMALISADLVASLLHDAGVSPADVRAIGSHGQTVRHRPGEFDGIGYTLQLNSPALLAERSGIDVICDFRSRDVAAGGQGAPLVPAFHAALWGKRGASTAVLNLGGMANLTLLGADGEICGFDCGPANALMDSWCLRHLGKAFDADGQWAASGQIQPQLLDSLLSDPFFTRQPPKSTGRDLFNPAWLETHRAACAVTVTPADVQATLAEMVALGCTRALQRHGPKTTDVFVCGGGAFNKHLLRRLAAQLPVVHFSTTDALGLPPDQVEAAAFAWLARCFVERRPGNRVEVTGACGLRVLGALYPGTSAFGK